MRIKGKIAALALAVIMAVPAFSATVSADGEEKILFHETFDGNVFTVPSVWSGHIQTFSNGEMLLPFQSWPALNLPVGQMNAAKSYELSYRIMFEKVPSVNNSSFRCYDYTNNVSFGCAIPEKGWSWKNCATEYGIAQNPEDAEKSPAEINTWYTVKTEFCTDSANRYMRHTLLDEGGNVLFTKRENTIYSGLSDVTEIDASTPVTFTSLYFWNNEMDSNVHIDDVILKEVDKTEPDDPEINNTVFEENFDSQSFDALHARGWQRESAGIGFENGALSVAPDAYVYVRINNKSDIYAYRFTYDIMAKNAGVKNGGLNFYAEAETSWSLGFFNSVSGFNCGKVDFGDDARVIKGTEAGKWYTVQVEFYENAEGGYIIYTLFDKETGESMGTYSPSYFEGQETSGAVSGNSTYFCLWNRLGSTETYLIDNMKLENLGAKPSLKTDEIIIRDMVGNEITDLKSAISPGIADIVLDFTAELDADSAEQGVVLAERSEDGDVPVEVTRKINGQFCTISPTEMLKANTQYVIKAAKTVTNTSGAALPQSYAVTFKTGSPLLAVEADGIYAGDTKIDSFSSLKANTQAVIKAKAMNPTFDDVDVLVCVSYYSGGKLERTEAFITTLSARSGRVIENAVTVPSDIANCDSVQAVFWNTAFDMQPYCRAITLTDGK